MAARPDDNLQRLVGTVVFRGCNLYQKIRPHMWERKIGPKLGNFFFMGGGGGQIPFYRDAISPLPMPT